MIRHIVFFSAASGVEPRRIQEKLQRLADIPFSQSLEVSLNLKSDPLGGEIDVVVYAEFADESALAAYRAHPLYAEVTREVRGLRELRYSANVESRSDEAGKPM